MVYPPGKGEPEKGRGGSNTKGCFNSLLSSVAEQEEEKAGSQLFSELVENESESSPAEQDRGGRVDDAEKG